MLNAAVCMELWTVHAVYCAPDKGMLWIIYNFSWKYRLGRHKVLGDRKRDEFYWYWQWEEVWVV